MAARKKAAPIHLCIDRIIPLEWKTEAAALAIQENPANGPPPPAPRRTARGVTRSPLKLALETAKLWKNGRTLGVRFLDGSPLQRKKTQQYAEKWLPFANIKFDFSAGKDAEIRVSFVADSGSWSAVGTDCLLRKEFPLKSPTMNFGWLRDDSAETEWERVVVHEFGHALGAIHEHSNPDGGIQWNKPAVYKYFGGPPNNWTKEDIDFNVLDKYSLDQINGTKFDPDSIMLYAFPPQLTLNHKGTHENNHLSTLDKAFIKKMYPK